jgi:hypothetical protein
MTDDTVPVTSDAPLLPTRQELVPFYDGVIVAVLLPDGRIAATLASLCDRLGLAPNRQARRIRADDLLADEFLPATIETSGGPQTMGVLTAWAIPLWLTGVQISRVAEERRAAILAYKREAANVLYRHFSSIQQIAPPSALVSAEPIEKPVAPGDDATLEAWRGYHQAMIAWLDWQSDMAAWRSETNARLDGLQDEVESLHEVVRLVPEILERLGPQTLSPEHQSTTQEMVKRLHDLTGYAFSTIYTDLNRSFRVGKYSDIPDARWPDVAQWFSARIAAAERRRG